MDIYITYGGIFLILLVLELCYFKVADRFNIIDKPNERSSHSTIVLRGGGIIFLLGLWIWAIACLSGLTGLNSLDGIDCWPFLIGLSLVAIVSFIDDIRSLPDSVRLVAQFVAMGLMFYNIGMFTSELLWMVIPALIVCVGATNIINFMDGINGITGAYAMAVLVPLAVLNGIECIEGKECIEGVGSFVDQSLIYTVMIADVVFCLFNFRPKGKAKCFAGDVGSIGIAYILLFMIGSVIIKTGDLTYLIFLLVYGVDGVLTIGHRIMLHENLGEAHRKHAYQLMANELKIGHVKVSSFYALLQLAVSLGFIGMTCVMNANGNSNSDIVCAHWGYMIAAIIVLSVAYVLFKKKYYHLHEEYLASLKKK